MSFLPRPFPRGSMPASDVLAVAAASAASGAGRAMRPPASVTCHERHDLRRTLQPGARHAERRPARWPGGRVHRGHRRQPDDDAGGAGQLRGDRRAASSGHGAGPDLRHAEGAVPGADGQRGGGNAAVGDLADRRDRRRHPCVAGGHHLLRRFPPRHAGPLRRQAGFHRHSRVPDRSRGRPRRARAGRRGRQWAGVRAACRGGPHRRAGELHLRQSNGPDRRRRRAVLRGEWRVPGRTRTGHLRQRPALRVQGDARRRCRRSRAPSARFASWVARSRSPWSASCRQPGSRTASSSGLLPSWTCRNLPRCRPSCAPWSSRSPRTPMATSSPTACPSRRA